MRADVDNAEVSESAVTVRFASPSDARDIERLAKLDSAPCRQEQSLSRRSTARSWRLSPSGTAGRWPIPSGGLPSWCACWSCERRSWAAARAGAGVDPDHAGSHVSGRALSRRAREPHAPPDPIYAALAGHIHPGPRVLIAETDERDTAMDPRLMAVEIRSHLAQLEAEPRSRARRRAGRRRRLHGRPRRGDRGHPPALRELGRNRDSNPPSGALRSPGRLSPCPR